MKKFDGTIDRATAVYYAIGKYGVEDKKLRKGGGKERGEVRKEAEGLGFLWVRKSWKKEVGRYEKRVVYTHCFGVSLRPRMVRFGRGAFCEGAHQERH
jgi:hypothetical protein